MPRFSLTSSITRSVDAPAALLPHFPALFAGIESLGSSPRLIERLLRDHGILAHHRILDLACGKGAAAIHLSRTIGCATVGIDACESFIDHARARASRLNLADRCTFITGDARAPAAALRRALPSSRRTPRALRFDAALMLGLFPLPHAAAILRPLTRPGGLYLIDDCWFDPRPAAIRAAGLPRDFRAPRSWLTLESARAVLEHAGDRVLTVHTTSPSSLRALNDRLYARLRANAAPLGASHPRLRPALRQFLLNQRQANRVLGTALRPAVWVVRCEP